MVDYVPYWSNPNDPYANQRVGARLGGALSTAANNISEATSGALTGLSKAAKEKLEKERKALEAAALAPLNDALNQPAGQSWPDRAGEHLYNAAQDVKNKGLLPTIWDQGRQAIIGSTELPSVVGVLGGVHDATQRFLLGPQAPQTAVPQAPVQEAPAAAPTAAPVAAPTAPVVAPPQGALSAPKGALTALAAVPAPATPQAPAAAPAAPVTPQQALNMVGAAAATPQAGTNDIQGILNSLLPPGAAAGAGGKVPNFAGPFDGGLTAPVSGPPPQLPQGFSMPTDGSVTTPQGALTSVVTGAGDVPQAVLGGNNPLMAQIQGYLADAKGAVHNNFGDVLGQIGAGLLSGKNWHEGLAGASKNMLEGNQKNSADQLALSKAGAGVLTTIADAQDKNATTAALYGLRSSHSDEQLALRQQFAREQQARILAAQTPVQITRIVNGQQQTSTGMRDRQGNVYGPNGQPIDLNTPGLTVGATNAAVEANQKYSPGAGSVMGATGIDPNSNVPRFANETAAQQKVLQFGLSAHRAMSEMEELESHPGFNPASAFAEFEKAMLNKNPMSLLQIGNQLSSSDEQKYAASLARYAMAVGHSENGARLPIETMNMLRRVYSADMFQNKDTIAAFRAARRDAVANSAVGMSEPANAWFRDQMNPEGQYPRVRYASIGAPVAAQAPQQAPQGALGAPTAAAAGGGFVSAMQSAKTLAEQKAAAQNNKASMTPDQLAWAKSKGLL